jgi:hypothetical protein
METTSEMVNETGTRVSERVHLREIVVIPSLGVPSGRLPFAGGADISPATPTSAFQGRDHGD